MNITSLYMAEARKCKNILDAQVYASLCEDTDPDTAEVFTSATKIAENLGSSRQAVQKAMRRLQHLGMIVDTGSTQGNRPTRQAKVWVVPFMQPSDNHLTTICQPSDNHLTTNPLQTVAIGSKVDRYTNSKVKDSREKQSSSVFQTTDDPTSKIIKGNRVSKSEDIWNSLNRGL